MQSNCRVWSVEKKVERALVWFCHSDSPVDNRGDSLHNEIVESREMRDRP
jgi:hypothetical protein